MVQLTPATAAAVKKHLDLQSDALMVQVLGEARQELPSLNGVADADLLTVLFKLYVCLLESLRGDESTGDPREIFLDYTRNLMNYIDSQSSYTVGHTEAVARHVVQMASLMKLSDSEIAELEYAAWVHNIGLINQYHRLSTLNRMLTADELTQARNHANIGVQMMKPIEFLSHLVPTVLYHHTHYGTTTPGEPRGEHLPLGAKLIMLADAYQAMLEGRAYRDPMSRRQALDEIHKASGHQFDPKLVVFAGALA